MNDENKLDMFCFENSINLRMHQNLISAWVVFKNHKHELSVLVEREPGESEKSFYLKIMKIATEMIEKEPEENFKQDCLL